jgi:hypothetical protein
VRFRCPCTFGGAVRDFEASGFFSSEEEELPLSKSSLPIVYYSVVSMQESLFFLGVQLLPYYCSTVIVPLYDINTCACLAVLNEKSNWKSTVTPFHLRNFAFLVDLSSPGSFRASFFLVLWYPSYSCLGGTPFDFTATNSLAEVYSTYF